VSLRTPAAGLLVAALAIASCSRSRAVPAASPAATPAPVTGTQPRANPAAPVIPAKAATPGVARAPPPRPGPAPAPAPADTGTYGLLALGAAQARVMPEDFLIGPVGDSRGLSGDERAAFAAASTFLEAFCRGSVEDDLLAAPSREELAGMLRYAVARGEVPTSWRLGSPHRSRGQMVCTVRLLGAPGTAEGDMYLAKDGGSWMVTDLQVNLAQLAAPRPDRGERFFPSPYQWLLGE